MKRERDIHIKPKLRDGKTAFRYNPTLRRAHSLTSCCAFFLWLLKSSQRANSLAWSERHFCPDPFKFFPLKLGVCVMLSGGPLDVESQAACRMAYATFLRHGGEAHDATLLYHYYSLPPYFCSFVKMILFIAEKEKENKNRTFLARGTDWRLLS